MGETWGIREGDYADRGILISFYWSTNVLIYIYSSISVLVYISLSHDSCDRLQWLSLDLSDTSITANPSINILELTKNHCRISSIAGHMSIIFHHT